MNNGGSFDVTFQNLETEEFLGGQGLEIVGIANPLNQNEYETGYGRLRYGDLNRDGFPDIFLTLVV